ncbi:type IV pilin [Natronorubrum sp. FCH18a]|uniref:type IV pilin n=1 Tax=Natronorubrum sp. FCH18a TaxID=3447018 RepID=UPI003F51075B
MRIPLEPPIDRALNPVVGGLLLVGLTVLCSAAVGTVLIGFESDIEGENVPDATVEASTLVRDDTEGFVTLEVTSMTRADHVDLTARTIDGTATIADGTANGTADLVQRREAVAESVTIRKAVDSAEARDVEIRIVAVAHGDDAETRVFDRTVRL